MDARMWRILVLALVTLSGFIAQAQIIPSGWSGCTVAGEKGSMSAVDTANLGHNFRAADATSHASPYHHLPITLFRVNRLYSC